MLSDKLQASISHLPYYVHEYFIHRNDDLGERTKQAYALDFSTFFTFLNNQYFNLSSISEIDLCNLESLNISHLNAFEEYLKSYTRKVIVPSGKVITIVEENTRYGIVRKFLSLKTLFSYLRKSKLIDNNIFSSISITKPTPRPGNDDILTHIELAHLLSIVDDPANCEYFSVWQLKYLRKYAKRDAAILYLFSGVSLRIGELHNLNVDDVNIEERCITFKVAKRSAQKDELKKYYFNEEVANVLEQYLNERTNNKILSTHSSAFFISIQGSRMSTVSLRNIVDKYVAALEIKGRNITPTSLRHNTGLLFQGATKVITKLKD